MKKALIIVDFQKDFVDGALGFEGAEALDEKMVQKIEEELSSGTDLYFTLDTHDENYLETPEGHKLPAPHCIKGTPGWEVFGKTASFLPKAERVFEKATFGSLELGNHLREKNYDRVELAGLVSNICVISNAVIAKAALPFGEVAVCRGLTDSYDKDLHKKTLDVLLGMQIDLVD